MEDVEVQEYNDRCKSRYRFHYGRERHLKRFLSPGEKCSVSLDVWKTHEIRNQEEYADVYQWGLEVLMEDRCPYKNSKKYDADVNDRENNLHENQGIVVFVSVFSQSDHSGMSRVYSQVGNEREH